MQVVPYINISYSIKALEDENDECFCKGVASLVSSLEGVAPLVCSSSGSRGPKMYNSWAAATGVTAKPMIIDTDMVIIVQDIV